MRLIDRLETETRGYHRAGEAEALLAAVNEHGYRTYLTATLGFVAPVERTICATPDIGRYFDTRRFNKEVLLRRDLLALRMTAGKIAGLPHATVPTFETAAEAIGWAYVVERSTLAHQEMYRRLAAANPGELAFASAYLKCYSVAIGEMWRGFGEALDLVSDADAAAAVVQAAHGAFALLASWQAGLTSVSPGATGTDDLTSRGT